MTLPVVFHVSGNRMRPLPQAGHTTAIWRQLCRVAVHYHVFARAESPGASTSVEGNIILHLWPSYIRSEAEALLGSLRLIPWIRKLRPSVIICQCPVIGGLAATLGSLLFGVPLLVELHGEHFFRDRKRNAKARLFQWLARPALRRAKSVRVLAAGMRESLRLTYGDAVGRKAAVIPTRVDLGVFGPAKSDYSIAGRLRVVTVGSFIPLKNHLKLIESVAHLPDVELTIVGAGPLRASYEHKIHDMNIADRVRLLPWMKQEELARVLAAHDVYVHPSWTEALSRAILEAMAMGLPVVATSVGFVGDAITSGENGVLVEPGSRSGLTAAISALLQSASERERLGRSGHSTIVANYEANKVFADYRKLIVEVAQSGQSGN